jgi:electron transfer flavoprotein alpha subunit
VKILVITEQRQGKWNNTSFETLVAAQQISAANSGTVSAVVIGKNVAALGDEIGGKNVAEVLLVEHDLLDAYTPDGYSIALKQVVEAAKPDLVLFPHTYQVRDFSPKLAAMLGKGMIGDCIGFCSRCFRGRRRPMSRSPEPLRGSLHSSPEHFARICSRHIPVEKHRSLP